MQRCLQYFVFDEAEIQRQVHDAKLEESIFKWIDKQKRELTADDILAHFEIEKELAEKIYNRYIGIEKPTVNLREKKRKLEEMESKSLSPRVTLRFDINAHVFTHSIYFQAKIIVICPWSFLTW